MNLCSKCYKYICLNEERTTVAKAPVESSFNVESSRVTVTMVVSSETHKMDLPAKDVPYDGQSTMYESKQRLKASNRYRTCNKKVELVGFSCAGAVGLGRTDGSV